MARLRKRDVETLMAAVDTELLPDALAVALRRALDVDDYPGDWAALVALAAPRGGWPRERRDALLAGDLHEMAALAVELNERREL